MFQYDAFELEVSLEKRTLKYLNFGIEYKSCTKMFSPHFCRDSKESTLKRNNDKVNNYNDNISITTKTKILRC